MLHKFIFDGTRIVLDVHSGAVHEVDELVWDLLERYGKVTGTELIEETRDRYDPREVTEALEEIKELEESGLLFSPDPFQGEYNPPAATVTKALCLHLAHSCNLGCRYCFAGQGRFGGDDQLMPVETGRAAIDFLIERSSGRKHLEIDFFGGEPLLNFKVLRELVFYGEQRARERGKVFKFTVTTNALLLNKEVSQFLNEHAISVVLSLDGRQPVHDKMRPFPGGAGSYGIIASRIKTFVDSRPDGDYIIRGTYTRHNLDFCNDVIHMAELGFRHLSVEPVVAPEEEPYAIRREDLPQVFFQYEQLTRELLQRREAGEAFDFFHFKIDLKGGPCLPKRLTGCGAGYEYLAVAPNGDLYPCHQFVGKSKYLMGNVFNPEVDSDLAAAFRRAHIYNKEGCAGCWAKFYCSGGCHANAEAANGSIYKPHEQGCSLVRKRLECALYLKVKEAGRQ
ncbi:MAG: hypothetical protein BWY80_00330 [Firmicutes bacterium ADurb.Bin456]|nr:MAG: hypothetical protein BWY80_00330 [Firmicutes bacterium ADurb.Bin456]